MSKSKNIFHMEVEPGREDLGFLCSLVYGPSVWRGKEGFWQELQHLAPNNSPLGVHGGFH